MLKGKVTNIQTGEALPGINVYKSDAAGNITTEGAGATTDSNGNYSFNYPYPLTGGPQFVTASGTGFEPKTWIAPSTGTGTRNFALQQGVTLAGITVTGKAPVKKFCCMKKAIIIFAAVVIIIIIYKFTRRRALA